MTECKRARYEFQAERSKQVIAEFSGERLTSDGGLVVLRELDRQEGIIDRFVASCLVDQRHAGLVTHRLETIVRQRIFALCAGDEDINDHDQLRHDPMFALCSGEEVLPARSTLNRFEKAGAAGGKILTNLLEARKFFVKEFIRSLRRRPERVIIDIDANAVPLFGEQERRYFSRHYNNYCYLPLLMYIGNDLVFTKLRDAKHDVAAGTVAALKTVVGQLRAKYPKLNILIRADSGFCRDDVMTWCERSGVDYLLGVPKNSRLNEILAPTMECARIGHERTGLPARCFADFTYQTNRSWSRERRVVGKAEYLEQGPNPRYVVTSLSKSAVATIALYEKLYCQRGDMENRIKEQLQLFSDRLSNHTFRGNIVRHYLSGVAYVLMSAFRRRALRRTQLASAYFDTIRLRLFKIGAQISYSCRRILIRLADSFPLQDVFSAAFQALRVT